MILRLLFISLVIADTVLTYKAIRSGKGRETAFSKRYIKNVPLTILITAIGVTLILLLTWETPWILIMPIIIFGYACWRSWEVLK
jgi:hypothetical protein